MPGILGKLSAASPWLDATAETLRKAVSPILGENGPQPLKDALYGVWVGHPLHPFMTDVTLGSLTTSMVLDALGAEEGADLALKFGVLTSGVTALSGAAQWYDATNSEEPRRLGALHATLNSTALGLYIASWVFRENDRRAAGIATAWTGHALSHASGYIGGHLTYILGIGVDRTVTLKKLTKWSDTGLTEADLTPGELRRIDVKKTPVMLLKQDSSLYAASPVCPHLQGPLEKGELEGTCVECPWHKSVFDLSNGKAIHGPATAPLPIYETRIVEGRIEVRTRPEE